MALPVERRGVPGCGPWGPGSTGGLPGLWPADGVLVGLSAVCAPRPCVAGVGGAGQVPAVWGDACAAAVVFAAAARGRGLGDRRGAGAGGGGGGRAPGGRGAWGAAHHRAGLVAPVGGARAGTCGRAVRAAGRARRAGGWPARRAPVRDLGRAGGACRWGEAATRRGRPGHLAAGDHRQRRRVAVPTTRPSGLDDPAEQVALFRFRVIAEPANPRLSAAERGRLVRALAAQTHAHPDGTMRAWSRGTLDRWIAAYQARGLDGLRPAKRSDAGVVRRHPELLAEAAALRAEQPARAAAHIADILRARHGIVVSERTVRAHLRRKGLDRASLGSQPTQVFGRYEAERPNQRWIGDVLTGPFVPHPRTQGSKRAKLFLLVDDHSRLLVHGRWVAEENTRAGQDVLRQAIVRRGLPETLYVDNGAPYSNAALQRCCAVLGIRLVHSQPYRPQGRGKQER